MDFIEIITLRSSAAISNGDKAKFLESLFGYCDSFPALKISVYHQTSIESDISFHLHWHGVECNGEKSKIGYQLADYLLNLGLVHHTLWQKYVCTKDQDSVR